MLRSSAATSQARGCTLPTSFGVRNSVAYHSIHQLLSPCSLNSITPFVVDSKKYITCEYIWFASLNRTSTPYILHARNAVLPFDNLLPEAFTTCTDMCSSNCLLVILAIIFPPLPVWVKRGLCSADSLINIALCCLGFLPGLLHSWYIISITPDEYEYHQVSSSDPERDGHVSYYYVTGPHARPASEGQQHQPNYGTTGPSHPNAQNQASSSGAGPSDGDVPPSYHDTVKGDNKIQTS